MSYNIDKLKNYFDTPDDLVMYIEKNYYLKRYFMNGACGQLAKIIYEHFINKRKKNYQLLCFLDADSFEEEMSINDYCEKNFVEKYGMAGIEHVAIIIDGKVYDACGVKEYNPLSYDHERFSRHDYFKKTISLKNVAQSKKIFENILYGHSYGNEKQRDIIERILNAMKIVAL